MGIEAVVFDLDGVLVDSIEAWYSMQKVSFKKYSGREISFEDWKTNFWGKDSTEMYRILGLPPERIAEAIKWQSEELMNSIDKIKPVATALIVLESVKDLGAKIGILSNNKKEFITAVLKHFGFYKFFDSIVGDEVEPKPSPKGLLKSVENLGAKKENSVFVGDTETDLKAGNAAGIKTIIIGKNVKSLDEVPAFINWNEVKYF